MLLFKKNLNVENMESIEGIGAETEDIKINIDGEIIRFKEKVYIHKNRYYLSLSELISLKGGVLSEKSNSIKFILDNDIVSIKLSKGSWINKNKAAKKSFGTMKKPLFKENNSIYISLIDFTNILDLKTRWNSEEKTIKIYRDIDHVDVNSYARVGGQKGILRLEDIAIGGSGTEYDSNYLECTRYMGAYLGKKSVPYHVAWIPRYIDKQKNVDGDPSKENKFTFAEMIYTLDYLSFRSGVIGLHGYTHQREDEESGIGCEFGKDYPSVEELKERVEKAIKIAEYLDIKVEFFEAPHYVITLEQNKMLQKYFKYILNNYNCEEHLSNQIDIIKANDYKEAYYIPTPLYYVDDTTGDNMVRVIKNMDSHVFAGLFYHPIVEHTLMDFKEGENGYPLIEYKAESTMKKVIDALEGRGIHMLSVNEIG